MIEIGQKLIQDNDKTRMELQSQWEKMYLSEYIYTRVNTDISIRGKAIGRKVDPLVPLPATVSEISSDLLFGEMPVFDFQDDSLNKKIIDYLSKYELETQLLEAAAYLSAIGTIFWQLYKIDNEIYWKFLKANKIIWDENIRGDITWLMVLSVYSINSNKSMITYDVVEHILEGDELKKYRIEYYKVDVDINTGKVKSTYDKIDELTELDFIPIIKVINIGMMNSVIGKSDYQGKEQLFAEIDNRIDQNNNVLENNADPWTLLPPGVLNQHGYFNKRLGKWIEKGPTGTDNTVDVVTWDASLSASFQQIEKMINQIFFTSRISPPIAGLDNGGYAESGRALKWRSINTLSMINRKRKYWNVAFRKFFTFLNALDNDIDFDVSKLVVKWQDGLPSDTTEKIQNVTSQVSSGLMSKLTGIQETQELGQEAAQDEYNQVLKEKGDEADIQARSMPVGF